MLSGIISVGVSNEESGAYTFCGYQDASLNVLS